MIDLITTIASVFFAIAIGGLVLYLLALMALATYMFLRVLFVKEDRREQ